MPLNATLRRASKRNNQSKTLGQEVGNCVNARLWYSRHSSDQTDDSFHAIKKPHASPAFETVCTLSAGSWCQPGTRRLLKASRAILNADSPLRGYLVCRVSSDEHAGRSGLPTIWCGWIETGENVRLATASLPFAFQSGAAAIPP